MNVMGEVALGLLIVAGASVAATTKARPDDMAMFAHSTVTIRATQAPGAVAEVEFVNDPSNSDDDNESRPLTYLGVSVTVTFTWNTDPLGSDRIEIETDADHIAVPRVIDVQESATGMIVIYPLKGLGM